ncbi:MAG: DNA gyrase inhibitor YacG [Zoogloeaceae bacterium]|nr:DNA gyrase inhibitor YacG [Zoogloeaceae bacterium]
MSEARDSIAARVINCPRCGRETRWEKANSWRPFCSERCKLIDLGHWAEEKYRLPETESLSGSEERPP